jgi:ADP-ribose pyrophosphatase YjhB (NUDIX family)
MLLKRLLSRPVQTQGAMKRIVGASTHYSRFLSSSAYSSLPTTQLPYECVEVHIPSADTVDTAEFAVNLVTTAKKLRCEGKSAAFMKVHMDLGHLIPVAGMVGFRFHHAEGEWATLMLHLREGPCKVPPFATHHLGVGCVVLKGSDTDRKILLVKEKFKYNRWKLPGGYCDLGEDISVSSVREVLEETGVATSFKSVLALRHSHNVQFGNSDIYLLCQLEYQGDNAPDEIVIDSEIEDATWMSLDQFDAQNEHPMLRQVVASLRGGFAGLKEAEFPSQIPGKEPFKMYFKA